PPGHGEVLPIVADQHIEGTLQAQRSREAISLISTLAEVPISISSAIDKDMREELRKVAVEIWVQVVAVERNAGAGERGRIISDEERAAVVVFFIDEYGLPAGRGSMD